MDFGLVLRRPIESTVVIRHVANPAQSGALRSDDTSFSFNLEFMENNRRGISRILRLLVVLTSCAMGGLASASPEIQPVATLDLSLTHRCCGRQPGWTTVAFTSDTTIAVSLCRGGCSLSLIRWDGDALRLSATTVTDGGAVSIYPANEGLIFSTGKRTPMALYSPDLSTTHDLPPPVTLVSASGKIAAETSGERWKLYRIIATTLQLALEGAGRLQSFSDEIRVVQDGNVMNVATLDGVRLGSFSVLSESGCASFAKLIGGNRLYLNDCKVERIVNFDGKTLLQLSPPRGCCFSDDTWSADGKRLLYDYRDRKVFLLRNAGEIVRMFATLGMSGEEWPNREEVRVVDTPTGKPYLDSRRSFATANDVELGKIAAISPSGQFVAIVTKDRLSIYRLPAACEHSLLASTVR
jgi:hypothetical protein